jgi:hypothetical protein
MERAASRIVVPLGTVTERPSIVSETVVGPATGGAGVADGWLGGVLT